MKPYALFPVLLLLTGCMAVGPDFTRPELDLSPTYIYGGQEPVGVVSSSPWWQQYNDTRLNDLIERGLKQNLDIQLAIERIQEARANLRATGLNAALDGGLTATSERQGGEDITTSTSNSAGLDASFVIDLFGGIQREREMALANLQAAQADLQTSQLAWLAECIGAYANARFYQTAARITEETISNRQETVDVTRKKYQAGAATEYEVAESEALLATAMANLPEYHTLYNANLFALASLLDEPAAPLFQDLADDASPLMVPKPSPIGLPAELLRNRPDVRSAEAALAAAVAEVGMAEADLYPAIHLSGTITLLEGGDQWSFGPSLTLPVFNRGALAAARDAQRSAALQAEISYRSTVLGAVEDVQIAQSNVRQYRLRAQAYQEAAASYQHSLQLARQNYRAGAITLLDLLDTDRSTAAARINTASAQNDLTQEWASLQIAIGAGALPPGNSDQNREDGYQDTLEKNGDLE